MEVLKTPAFWLLYAMFTMVATGGLMATAQLGPIARDFKVASIPVNLFGLTMAASPRAERGTAYRSPAYPCSV